MTELVASALTDITKQKPSARQGRTGKVHIWSALEPHLPDIWQAISQGVTRRAVYQRLNAAGVKISYSGFTEWLNRHPPVKAVAEPRPSA